MAFEIKPDVVLDDTYRLIEVIGRGGMGEVWRAQHERLPKQVAVKVLLAAASVGSVVLARFRREAEIASRLGHPNIVQVLDFNTLPGGLPYMVLELLAGESLRQRLRRGPLTLDEVLNVLRQVCSALREAHRQGVVHRDLKPENIFLCQEESGGNVVTKVKILDFGISKIQGSETALTRDAEVLGTPLYMAPEQAAGRHHQIDGRTDEFALAAIAYEALTGIVAFGGQTLAEVVHKIMSETPRPLHDAAPTLPNHVSAAIDRALAKDVSERFDTVTDFIDALSGKTVPRAESDGPTVRSSRRETPLQDGHMPTVLGTGGQEAAAFAATAVSQDGHDAATSATAVSQAAVAPADRLAPTTPERTPVGRRKTRRGAVVLAGVASAIVLCGGAAMWFARSRSTVPPTKVAAVAGLAADATAGVRPNAVLSDDGGIGGRDAGSAHAGFRGDAGFARAAASLRDGALGQDVHATKRPRQPSVGRVALSPEVRSLLDQAKRAVSRGDYDQALLLARRTLIHQKSAQAYAIMLRAYCARRDLRMAKAMLHRLGGSARRHAIRWCEGRGMRLSTR